MTCCQSLEFNIWRHWWCRRPHPRNRPIKEFSVSVCVLLRTDQHWQTTVNFFFPPQSEPSELNYRFMNYVKGLLNGRKQTVSLVSGSLVTSGKTLFFYMNICTLLSDYLYFFYILFIHFTFYYFYTLCFIWTFFLQYFLLFNLLLLFASCLWIYSFMYSPIINNFIPFI